MRRARRFIIAPTQAELLHVRLAVKMTLVMEHDIDLYVCLIGCPVSRDQSSGVVVRRRRRTVGNVSPDLEDHDSNVGSSKTIKDYD